jgi:hypothetical protein
MYVQWQGLSIIETRRANKQTGNGGDSVAECEERTATVCELQDMQTEDSF